MTEEIKLIIEKNLPAQVGDTLKKVLEKAKLDAETVIAQKEQINALIEEKHKLQATIENYKQFDDRNRSLEAREKACELEQRELRIKTLEYQLEAEKDKTAFSKSVALGLVRNIEYRRTLIDSKNTPSLDQFGNTLYVNSTQNSTETNIAE